jgi:hypothetical protein
VVRLNPIDLDTVTDLSHPHLRENTLFVIHEVIARPLFAGSKDADADVAASRVFDRLNHADDCARRPYKGRAWLTMIFALIVLRAVAAVRRLSVTVMLIRTVLVTVTVILTLAVVTFIRTVVVMVAVIRTVVTVAMTSRCVAAAVGTRITVRRLGRLPILLYELLRR